MEGVVCKVTLFLLLGRLGAAARGSSFEDFDLTVPLPLRDNFPKDRWSLYLPTEVKNNSLCRSALDAMMTELSEMEITPSHKLVDSWGKTSSGYMIGLMAFHGVYDECKNFVSSPNATGEGSYKGRYCNINLKKFQRKKLIYQEREEHPVFSLPWVHPAEVGSTIIDVLLSRTLANGTQVGYSTCIPDVCTGLDLQESLEEVVRDTDFILQGINCHLDLTSDPFSTEDIVFIVVLSVIAGVIVLASVVDIYIQKSGNKSLSKGGLRYLLPFSAYTNVQKLFHMNTETTPETITCLHGIRVLSMTWVVWAHQQMTTFVYTTNLFSMFDKMRGLLYQTALNGFPSVDTFFFIGGFLMAYSVLRQYKRSKRFNLFLFYFHRVLRLVPPILLTAGLYATVAKYFLGGPLASIWNYTRDICQRNWWMDVTFVSNFGWLFDEQSCLGQCWYLAVDSQLYLVAPLILLPILYNERLGMVWLYIVTMASFIVPAAVNYAYDLPPTSLLLDPKGTDFFNYNYCAPWCRAGPIYIGIWLGVFMANNGSQKSKLKPWEVLAGWTVAILTGLMVVYGVWSYNVYPRKIPYDVMTQLLYGGLHRPAWAAALAWVVFACYNGYGGFIDDFLSHPVWQPISRLTYSIYLVALSLQGAITYNTRIQFYFDHYSKVLETVGAIVMSVIPAILVSITAESPIIGIEKLLFRRPGRGERRPKEPSHLEGSDNKAFEQATELKEMEVPAAEVNGIQRNGSSGSPPPYCEVEVLESSSKL
ncbi:nose resistant to fluoxetine protein 6-like isoform X2 [Macrobrachium nipponense]|uniref:nose resistant to fluoxetine protein 6-like isoform X2 n=1 Tax=Macrobrachium nipponense TaxID=159736 RepID=UPI0030C829D4